MRAYEDAYKPVLTRRLPMVIRVDGRAFHTVTRGREKPFDREFAQAMLDTAEHLFRNVAGAALAYVQSDEISLLVRDDYELGTQPWFGKELPKVLSISAALASSFLALRLGRLVEFDARAFNLPPEEVTNYFIDRQSDATRNSILSLGQAHFSQKRLHGLSCDAVQDLLYTEHGINWNDVSVWQRRGATVLRRYGETIVDKDPPIFTQDREYVERRLRNDDEEPTDE